MLAVHIFFLLIISFFSITNGAQMVGGLTPYSRQHAFLRCSWRKAQTPRGPPRSARFDGAKAETNEKLILFCHITPPRSVLLVLVCLLNPYTCPNDSGRYFFEESYLSNVRFRVAVKVGVGW